MVKQAIKFFRSNSGLTQDELAELLNVDRSLISKYEHGVTLPPVTTLMRMAELFQVDYTLFSLCLDLTNYSLGQAKAIVLSNDPSCRTYFLPHELSSIQHKPETLSNLLNLSTENKALLINFLESYHGLR